MRPLGTSDPRSIGAYTVLGVLGQGGMGKVYLGQSWTGKRVALKVIRSEIADDPIFRQRFSREVDAARAISALYTAPIVDADPDAETPWFATMYIEGPSLEDEVAKSGPMSVPSILILAAGLAEAFIAIHRVGLVHRDLKPSNVLLTKDGPCVIDFGIALIPDAASLTQGVIGTPAYMSPEHVAGEEVGPASDIFSIGATLAFAATGQGPLGQGTPHSLIAKLISGQLDTSTVPEQLKPIIARCLARDAKYRPSASDLLSMLAAAGATHPYTGWFSPTAVAPAVPPASPASPGLAPASPGFVQGVAGLPGRPSAAWAPPAGSIPSPRPGLPQPPPATVPAGHPPSGPPQPQPHVPQVPSTTPYPVQGGYPAPAGGFPGQGYPPPPYPPGGTSSSKRPLWIALGLVLALLLVGGVTTVVLLANGGLTPSAQTQSSSAPVDDGPTTDDSTTTPANEGKLTLETPDELAGLSKNTDSDLQDTAEEVVKELEGKIEGESNAVAAFYNDPARSGSRVLFIGVTADIVSPTREIDDAFTSFNEGDIKIGNIAEVPAGPLGGTAKCGDGVTQDVHIVVCVWADHENLGLIVFYNRSVEDSQALMIHIREEASHRE